MALLSRPQFRDSAVRIGRNPSTSTLLTRRMVDSDLCSRDERGYEAVALELRCIASVAARLFDALCDQEIGFAIQMANELEIRLAAVLAQLEAAP
jgi:hypothetical protein